MKWITCLDTSNNFGLKWNEAITMIVQGYNIKATNLFRNYIVIIHIKNFDK